MDLIHFLFIFQLTHRGKGQPELRKGYFPWEDDFNMRIVLILLLFTSNVKGHSESIKNEEECKIADLCIHDKVPMCGIDSCGEMRTFIDTCDMHEFNCDSKKDFKQRPIHECWVTCKRGRSFKKPEFRTDCNLNIKPNRL